MAQPVPIHADKPKLLARGLELAVGEIVPVERATLAGGENQSFWIRNAWLCQTPSRKPSLPDWITRNQLRHFSRAHHRPKDGPYTLDRSPGQPATQLR